jgi:hypothetical protein
MLIFMGFNHHKDRSMTTPYEATYIHNPNILQVERGMMIRVNSVMSLPYATRFTKWKKTWSKPRKQIWGTLIEQVDAQHNKILVKEQVGGEWEFDTWVDLKDVDVVWWSQPTNTYEASIQAISAFNDWFFNRKV